MGGTLDNDRNGCIIINSKGRILYISKGILDFTGLSRESIIDLNIREIIPEYNEDIENTHVGIISRKNIREVFLKVNSTVYGKEDQLRFLEIEEYSPVRRQNKRLSSGKAIYKFDKIIGKSESFIESIEYCKKIADSRSTVLIMGESGTGKEVFAQAIHNSSSRRDEPFVAVNCGAIPQTLMESELFGYEEGAFTGARRGGNTGKFQQAQGGSIFLDEIGEMPKDMQIKLLRVIEEKVITKIGGANPQPVDVRVIAATNKDLSYEVQKGNFRKDLYYRLNVIPLYLPPLRERGDDINLLVEYIMERTSKKMNRKPYSLNSEERDIMKNYSWPGNIRELENVIEFMVNTGVFPKGLKDGKVRGTVGEEHLKMENMNLEYIEKKHILWVMRKAGGNVSMAAKNLGIGRNTLYRKLSKYNINSTMQKYCSKNE